MNAYLYWIPANEFRAASNIVRDMGLNLSGSRMTPCETLRVAPGRAIYATPQVFTRMCTRQGSWYNASKRNGLFLLLSPVRLSAELDCHLDAELKKSTFQPETLPTNEELQSLINSPEYKGQRPYEWEQVKAIERVMMKLFFLFNQFWGLRDGLAKHWLTHRANHANFLAARFTTMVDGEEVAHSVSENAGVCSSCVEFFNIITPDARKLVRACPGAATFGGAERDVFIDVRPIRGQDHSARHAA
ncbi:MAG: hypothetical protein ABJF50_16540 [Paracoccaceae bacterium]